MLALLHKNFGMQFCKVAVAGGALVMAKAIYHASFTISRRLRFWLPILMTTEMLFGLGRPYFGGPLAFPRN